MIKSQEKISPELFDTLALVNDHLLVCQKQMANNLNIDFAVAIMKRIMTMVITVVPRGNGDPFITISDFEKARLNRESHQAIYPDFKFETEESRLLRKSLSASHHKGMSTKVYNKEGQIVKVKFQPVYDPVTKTMKFS